MLALEYSNWTGVRKNKSRVGQETLRSAMDQEDHI